MVPPRVGENAFSIEKKNFPLKQDGKKNIRGNNGAKRKAARHCFGETGTGKGGGGVSGKRKVRGS